MKEIYNDEKSAYDTTLVFVPTENEIGQQQIPIAVEAPKDS